MDHPGTKYLHKDKFVRGKGLFHAIEWIPPAEPSCEDYPFLLTTGRVLYQYHTGTMSRQSSTLNEGCSECFIEINPKDAESLGIEDGDMVEVASRRGKLTTKAAVGEMTDAGTVFMPFHFFETPVNALTLAALDPVAKIPEYKVCAVKIEKAEQQV